jgi:hypothetical protein
VETPIVVADVLVAPVLVDCDFELFGPIEGDVELIPAEPWYDTHLPHSFTAPIVQEQLILLVNLDSELIPAETSELELPTNPVSNANPIEPSPILVDFDVKNGQGLIDQDVEVPWSVADAMTPTDQIDPILVDMTFKRIDWDDMTGIVLDPIVYTFLKVKYNSRSGVESEWSAPQRYRAFKSALERK